MIKKPILYIDLDGVIVDLIGELDLEIVHVTQTLEKPTDWIDLSETIFLNARPVPGALEAVAELEKHYEVFILSTAPWKNVHSWSQKRIWVEKYLPSMYKKLILTHNKELLIGDYLIDDRTKNGAAEFQGKHIHIFSDAYPTWDSVLEELIGNPNG